MEPTEGEEARELTWGTSSREEPGRVLQAKVRYPAMAGIKACSESMRWDVFPSRNMILFSKENVTSQRVFLTMGAPTAAEDGGGMGRVGCNSNR